jgi:RNA-binding protein
MKFIQLSSQQKKSLRSIAHHLDPIVSVSERGLSDAVAKETERALKDHELIKVKIFDSDRTVRQDTANQLAANTGAVVIQSIGKIAVLYRKNPTANPKLSNVSRYSDIEGL